MIIMVYFLCVSEIIVVISHSKQKCQEISLKQIKQHLFIFFVYYLNQP